MRPRRPIEQVVADLRLLAAEVDRGPVEGRLDAAGTTALAYDAALAEACAAVDVREDLRRALRGGRVLAERARVERALAEAGVDVRPDA